MLIAICYALETTQMSTRAPFSTLLITSKQVQGRLQVQLRAHPHLHLQQKSTPTTKPQNLKKAKLLHQQTRLHRHPKARPKSKKVAAKDRLKRQLMVLSRVHNPAPQQRMKARKARSRTRNRMMTRLPHCNKKIKKRRQQANRARKSRKEQPNRA